MRFVKDNTALVCFHQGEQIRIEPWGKDSFRVRAAMGREFSGHAWALTEPVESAQTQIVIEDVDHWVGDGTLDKREQASITNGRLKAVVNHAGVLSLSLIHI